jgi:hypothetical protein
MSGSGYAPQTITFSTSDGTGTMNQAADVNFPAATADWTNIVAWAVTDTSGNQFVFLPFTSMQVLNGSVVKFLVASNPIKIQYA